MNIKELFRIGDIMHSVDGRSNYLDRNNCRINNKSKKDDAVIFSLKKESDGEEGKSYLRVKEEYKSITSQLLNWVFISDRIIGLTLNELSDMETNLSIENFAGKIQLR